LQANREERVYLKRCGWDKAFWKGDGRIGMGWDGTCDEMRRVGRVETPTHVGYTKTVVGGWRWTPTVIGKLRGDEGDDERDMLIKK
jgi:hypothetical protein